MILPLYDQGTLCYIILPDDVDLAALWQAAEAGSILVKGEK